MKGSRWMAMAVSAAVFPGLGHFVVGRGRRGLPWLLAFFLAGAWFMQQAGAALTPLLEGMAEPSGPWPDLSSIPTGSLALSGIACALVWLGALVDCWNCSKPASAPAGDGLTPRSDLL